MKARLAKLEQQIAEAEAAQAQAELSAIQPQELYRVTDQRGPSFMTTDADGVPVVHTHAGQFAAYNASERFTLILAGTRGGKTALGPWWLLKVMRQKGPGEYLCAAPTYKLLKKGIYKALKRAFVTTLKLGTIVGGAEGEFRFSSEGFARVWPDKPFDDEAKVAFGHASNPDSLEAAEYKAAWLDEPGQRQFPVESWEAIQRRLSMDQGPCLMTTTPYTNLHWIKDQVYDAAQRAGTDKEMPGDSDYKVVSFESTMNPDFPPAEYERAQRTLPAWKFNLFYRGQFTRPAGVIYDCFDDTFHVVPAFEIPATWKRYVGIDFGAPNFAATFFAEEPAKDDHEPKVVAYREYRPNEARTAAQHVAELMRGEVGIPSLIVGGSKSEGQWRSEFRAAGYPIREPDQPDVEVGIDRVYAHLQEGRLFIFPNCVRLIDEFQSYSRPVDEHGNPMEGIVDKDTYHGLDSVRYIISYLRRSKAGVFARVL